MDTPVKRVEIRNLHQGSPTQLLSIVSKRGNVWKLEHLLTSLTDTFIAHRPWSIVISGHLRNLHSAINARVSETVKVPSAIV